MVARLCAVLSNWIPEKIICCAKKALAVHAAIGYKVSKLSVVPNGYDLDCFMQDKELGAQIRQELSLGHTEFVIGNIGRFDPLKDHFNLLQALSFVAMQGVSFRCLLVGKGLLVENDMLMARIVELNLQDNIILLGQRADIPAVMNAIDIHVLSSCSEASRM